MVTESTKDNIEKHDVDVITVKGTFLKLKSTTRFLLSKWVIIAIGGIIGAAIGFYVAYTTKPTYTGTLNFVLSTGAKSSNISGLASQFGIDVGGSATNDVFSGDNIITLFKSKKMLKSVLFKRPPDSTDILANIIVREWGWDKGWEKKDRTRKLFPFPQNGELVPVQDSLLREVINYVLKKQLTISRSDPKLSTYTLTTTSTNEVFACYLTRFLMDETAKFYIDTKTSTAKQSVQLLQKETDSLRNLLSGSITSTAAESDRTFALNPAMQVQKASAQKGQVRATVLASAYGEMVRNLELAKINLQKENPLYQIIDTPELPLVVTKMNKKTALVIGFLAGAFLLTCYVISARLLRSLNS